MLSLDLIFNPISVLCWDYSTRIILLTKCHQSNIHETRDWFPGSGWKNKETLLGLPDKSGHLLDIGGNISQEPRMSERREEEEELVG